MTDLYGLQSALAGTAQDFADGPHQHTRLLRLHTPLGADVLLAERAQITEGIGRIQLNPCFPWNCWP